MINKTWVQKETLFFGFIGAVNHDFCAFFRSASYVTGHLVTMFTTNQGTHLAGWVCARANFYVWHTSFDFFNKRIGNGVDLENNRDSHASLAGRTISSTDRGISSHIEIGVW